MRSKLWSIALGVVLLGVFTMLSPVHAGWKHCKGTGKTIQSGPEIAFDCGDWPKHQVSLAKVVSEQTCDCPELDEARQTAFEYHDRIAGSGGESLGYYTLETKGGGKIFGKYSGRGRTITKQDGSWEAHFMGMFEEYDGTGTLQGVKGKGTYWGKVTPTGVSYEWKGDYWFPDR